MKTAPRFLALIAFAQGCCFAQTDQAAPPVQAAPPALRPQTPMPPFPYRQIEVAFRNDKDGNAIAGTLTVPDGKGPFPAVVMISGSGAQDRDETVAMHKPFWVIADRLSRNGIAVLRDDDRGVGKSTGNLAASTTEDLAGDALAGIALLQERKGEIDPSRIGLIGHSEGGAVAAIAAARTTDVAFIVLLAGPGLPGRELLPGQIEALMRADGKDEASIHSQIETQGKIMAAVERDASAEELSNLLRSLARKQADARGAALSDAALTKSLAPQLAQIQSRWYRAFLKLDPRDYLRQVKCPVLALAGERDLQVPPDRNLPEIEKALKAGGNADITIVRIPELNHLFQTAANGAPSKYMWNTESFSPKALEIMTKWIGERTRR